MLNRRATIVSLTVELIKKYILLISEFSTEPKVKLNQIYLITPKKSRFKNVTGNDTSSFAKKVDLPNLNSSVNKLDIKKKKNVRTNLSNLKSNVDK